jgi:MOSC domain-containing protein YiiM
MDAAQQASLKGGSGIVGNADQGGARQVTLIEREIWDEVSRALRATVEPVMRRANLLVSGVRLADAGGRVLRVGACRIRIRGETKPCERMDEACEGLHAALAPRWGGGAYGEVLDDGEITVGDVVHWE